MPLFPELRRYLCKGIWKQEWLRLPSSVRANQRPSTLSFSHALSLVGNQLLFVSKNAACSRIGSMAKSSAYRIEPPGRQQTWELGESNKVGLTLGTVLSP